MKKYIFLALLLLVPIVALAAPTISFNQTPAAEYRVYEGGTYDVTIDAVGVSSYPTEVDFFVRGPIVGGMPEAEFFVGSYVYQTDGTHTFSWNGKFDGVQPEPGTYDVYIFGVFDQGGGKENTNDLTRTFTFITEPSPTVSGLGVTIDPFSPDGDGNQDTTTITFELNTDADVTVTVENEDGVTVRTLKDDTAESDGTVNVVWNGKESGGSVLPDGTYTVRVAAENSMGSDADTTTVSIEAPEPEPEPEPPPEPEPAPAPEPAPVPAPSAEQDDEILDDSNDDNNDDSDEDGDEDTATSSDEGGAGDSDETGSSSRAGWVIGVVVALGVIVGAVAYFKKRAPGSVV